MTPAAVQELVARYGVTGLSHRRVLVVDDEPENLVVLRTFLEPEYEVLDAPTGARALELAERHPLDVVVTDQRMPEMTGVALLERLRSSRPDVAGIVLTAYTDTPALLSAINDAHAFRFLKKPWQVADLLEAIAQASAHVVHTRAIARLVELLSARTDELAAALEQLRSAQHQMLHLERLSTIGRLAAGITHDLRNAMTGLVLVEGHLQRRGIPEDAGRALDVGLAGVRNLLGTLVTLNQFARAGEMTVDRVPVAPAEVVADALSVTRFEMELRGRRFETAVAPGLPRVLADRAKLVQVLVNFVRNAVQVTVEGQRIALVADRAGDRVVLAVEDEGPGVDPAIEARLFEPFVSSKGEGGMGLGLYMARLIVESHGGTIAARRRDTGGSRFEVTLPAAADEGDATPR